MEIKRSNISVPLEELAHDPQENTHIDGERIEETLGLWKETDTPEAKAFFEDLPEDADMQDAFAKLVKLVVERLV